MAAPSGTIWGSYVTGNENPSGRRGRIGIYTKVTNTSATQATVNVQVWFWTIYSCVDSANSLRFDVGTGITSASTKIENFTAEINHTVNSGEGWDTSNQTKLLDKTYTYTRGTSTTTYKAYARFYDIDMLSGKSMYANTSYTVPTLESYTIAYNANGGSGAPASQKKWYGKNLTLSSTKPTRTGYSFQGWALTKADADAGTKYYNAGGTCGKNENLTLYAVWEANTYAIKYNANGGSGAPSNQTKTYGVTLKLSTTKPTRTNYNFLGWATSASATTATYSAGGNYTANAAVTLYAVWELAYVKPRININTVARCDDEGNLSDTGTSVRIDISWECDRKVTSAIVTFESDSTDSIEFGIPFDTGSSSGSVENYVVGDGELSTEITYTVKITITDTVGYCTEIATINGSKFIIDILAGGEGVALNKPAELKGVFDVGFRTRLLGGILYVELPPETDLNDVLLPGFYVGENVTTYNYVNCPLDAGTFILEVKSAGPNGQLQQCLTLCDKKASKAFDRFYYGGDWPKDSNGEYIWSGQWIYPTLSNEFTVYGSSESSQTSYRPRYRKDGRTVEIRGAVAPAVEITGNTTNHRIFQLADGYRPSIPLYTLCQGSGTCTWMLRVNTDGSVDLARYRNGDVWDTASPNTGDADNYNATWLPFQVTFLTD